jgi:hypothetical protein
MAKGSWSATGSSGIILAADTDRAEIVLQHHAGGAVFVAFGEVAVAASGLRISADVPFLKISDYRARLAIHAVCALGVTATGGYETADRQDVIVSGESSLSMAYSDFLAEVGGFLGYGRDRAAWSAERLAEVDRYVQDGVRQFYYPPAVEGEEPGREWSFLKPTATLDTVADDGEQDLPDGFGRVLGDFHFEPDEYTTPIRVVSEARIQTLLQQDDDAGRPQFAAIRFKASTGAYGQRQEVVWWPIPDAAYTLTYRYEAFAGKLTDANPYPIGGMKHSATILESCLAVADLRANDSRGVHWEQFVRMLAMSRAQDRQNGARFYGSMGGGDLDAAPLRERVTSNITYKGSTW